LWFTVRREEFNLFHNKINEIFDLLEKYVPFSLIDMQMITKLIEISQPIFKMNQIVKVKIADAVKQNGDGSYEFNGVATKVTTINENGNIVVTVMKDKSQMLKISECEYR
jgi:hypothetical protein